MKRIFDKQNKDLKYYKNSPTKEYWDKHWSISKDIILNIISTKDTFVSDITKKWLDKDKGKILEGGCGKGQHVSALRSNGYDVIRLDFAEQTVEVLNKFAPQLKIIKGDVRDLPFNENYFSGYWSLGVIEHFEDIYENISKEMCKVIKPGGGLFLALSYISPLRKLKGRLRLYSSIKEKNDKFYQFALNSETVINNFSKLGFHLEKKHYIAGLKGLKDEIPIFKSMVELLIRYRGKNIFIKIIRKMLETLSLHFSAHSILLILKKKNESSFKSNE